MKSEARKEEVTEQDSSPASRDTLHASPRAAKRARRMIVWLVAAPIVILLLALAGANRKTFHLAYAKHLMSSSDASDQRRGTYMVIDTHVRNGMTLQEVRELLRPAELVKAHTEDQPYLRGWSVVVVGEGYKINPLCTLYFDEQGRLIFKPVD